MAKFTIGDIFIGNFSLSQKWAARPEVYAQFGQDGHNGWDFLMPNGSLIVSPCDGVCLGTFEEKNSAGELSGFGRYLKILHEQTGQYFVSVYAHLQSIEISKGQKLKKFQLIAKSDNNGFSTAPHLHFGVYLSDAQGKKTETNGFGGYHNPGDKKVFEWVIENPTKAYEPSLAETMGINDDAKRALDTLEKYRIKENHGNLEGAIDALVGSQEVLLTLQKDKTDLTVALELVKEDLRDKIGFIQGQNETLETIQKQQVAIADILAVANDFPVIKGEIVKLIAVEDEIIVLRNQLKTLKDGEGNAVGKVIAEYDKKIKELEDMVEKLYLEIAQLKSKRIVDRFSDGEKIWMGIVTFFGKIKSLPKDLFNKIFKRGGDKK